MSSSPILLQTNGIDNGSQTKLNLVAGSNVVLTDDDSGDVTIATSGSGSVSPGTQFHLAFYAADGSEVSPTSMTTDSEGQTLTVPALLISGQQDTTGTLVGRTGSTADYNPAYSQSIVDFTYTGPGWSLGNAGGTSGATNNNFSMASATRGIHQCNSFSIQKHAVGDTAGIYGYAFSDGGVSAQSDEGVTGITIETGENEGYFHGTVSSTTGPGDQAPVLTFTSGNAWTTDGAFLLNISQGALSGNMTGESFVLQLTTSAGVQNTYLNALPVTSGVLPASTAIGIVSGAIANQGVTANAPISATITVTLCQIEEEYKSFIIGEVVTVAGINYPEQSILTDVIDHGDGTQTLSLNLRNPNSQAIIFQGGIQGQYISFDANLSFSQMRSSYYAFGSLTGSELIYGVNVEGGVNIITLPQAGSEAAVADGGASSGFHLYPGAEVVCNTDTGYACTLEQNSVAWTVNDVVENPHYPAFGGTAAFITRYQQTPTNGRSGAVGLFLNMGGPGFGGGGTAAMQVFNSNPVGYYKNNGGPLLAPNGIALNGAFSNSIYFGIGPDEEGSLLFVQNPNNLSSPNDPVTVINIDYAAGGNIDFHPGESQWHINNFDSDAYSVGGTPGISGTFSIGGSTVVVTAGLITSIT